MFGKARMDFEPRPEEVRAARHFAARAANDWGVESWDLETVVGELAANAYRHAGTGFSVSVSHLNAILNVEVADGSSTIPAVSEGEQGHVLVSGRGLLMVEALALDWGARSTPVGKIVWAELPAARLDPLAPGGNPVGRAAEARRFTQPGQRTEETSPGRVGVVGDTV